MDPAVFNNLMHGWATSPQGQTDLRMAVLYSGAQFRDSYGVYHTQGAWNGRIVNGNYVPWPPPTPARLTAETEDPPAVAAVEAPLVAQNMHTDDPRTSTPGASAGAISAIRTLVPLAVGALLTWLATTLHIVVGPDSSAELVAVADAVLTAAYWSLARLLEQKWPALGVLLGYPAQPTYSKG